MRFWQTAGSFHKGMQTIGHRMSALQKGRLSRVDRDQSLEGLQHLDDEKIIVEMVHFRIGYVAVVIGIQNAFSRTFGDLASGMRTYPSGSASRQLLRRTLARKRAKPARPYMDLLITFNRFTWPSTGPLLHGSAIAACTAA